MSIRVTYSGFISLIIGLFNIGLGIGFTIIVTRTLDVLQYGTWGFIGGIVVYATIIEPVITYWTTREVAREEKSGKTGIFAGLIFSGIGSIIYVISVLITVEQTDAEQSIVLLGIILVPVTFLNRVLTSITIGWRPQGVSYGQIVFGATQVFGALFFVYFMKMNVEGVILTVTTAYVISILFYINYNKKQLIDSIKIKFLKKWVNLSWISMYPALGDMIYALDIMVFSVITHSVIGLAFWTASTMLSIVISNAGLISRAVYSKLLQGKNTEFVQDNVRHLFYFAILFLGFTITFAKPGLFVLNPEYIVAEYIVIFLALKSFLYVISGNLRTFVTGIETVDTDKNSTFKDYFKSKLIIMSTLELIQSISYIVFLSITISILVLTVESQIELVTYWAGIALIVQIPISIGSIILFKKYFPFKFDYKAIIKFSIVAVFVFGITHLMMEEFLEYKPALIDFFPSVVIFGVFGIMAYIGITISIDKKTRLLVKSVLGEIRNRN